MGGGKGGGGKASSKAADTQARLMEQLYRDTAQVRDPLLQRSGQFLSGGTDVTQTPAYQDMMRSAGIGFNQAKDNVISRFAPGGGMVDAMTNLEGQRATGLSQGRASLWDAEMNRALGLVGGGMTNTSVSGLGQAGQTQAQIALANSQASAGKSGALGTAAGMYMGGGGFGGKSGKSGGGGGAGSGGAMA